MFEQKIQFAWDDYIKDFALGRMILVSFSLNALFFFLGLTNSTVSSLPLYPIGLGLILLFYRDKIVNLKPISIFIIASSFLTFSIICCYVFTGILDVIEDGLRRFDYYLSSFDIQLLGMPVANWFQDIFGGGPLSFLYYDFIQVSYMTYFLFPIIGGLFLYQQQPISYKYRVGRFMANIMIFYKLNFLLYILIPVSGPQFFVSDMFTTPLPLSQFGTFLNTIISSGQPTYIDCFPSGHAGIAILVSFWMFRIRNHYRYVFLLFAVGMILATLSLRYHYVLDIIASPLLCIVSYKLAKLLFPLNIDVRSPRRWKY